MERGGRLCVGVFVERGRARCALVGSLLTVPGNVQSLLLCVLSESGKQ